MPSFPPELNEKNKNFILRGLNKIYQDDPIQWSQITAEIIEIWSHYHRLEAKHLTGANTEKLFSDTKTREGMRGRMIRAEAGDSSREMMKTTMEELILSTKNPIK